MLHSAQSDEPQKAFVVKARGSSLASSFIMTEKMQVIQKSFAVKAETLYCAQSDRAHCHLQRSIPIITEPFSEFFSLVVIGWR